MLGGIFKKKQPEIIRDANTHDITDIKIDGVDRFLNPFTPTMINGNMITLFNEIAELQFPVMSIVNRMCNGKFMLKESKTDSIVYECDEINKFLSQPNPLQGFDEFIRQAVIYKLVTGRSFIYSNMAGFLKTGKRWEMCDNYFVLPAHLTHIEFQNQVKLFSAGSKSDIIKCYRTNCGIETVEFSPDNILHLKDTSVGGGREHIDGRSRMEALKYPLSNLIAVYEARNAIYVKRGALGAIVSKKQDESGSIPLTETEKENIRKSYDATYGVTNGKDNILISTVPVEFIRFNQSIQELMPFDETLADAVQIAGQYNVPSVLIPRKDQSTFSNQDGAEKSLYENTVIPETQTLCKKLNNFLNLDKSGLFLDVSFDHIPVLQANAKEKAITDKMISETCKVNFLSGIITLNDWIAKTGGTRIPEKIYDKYILQMTDEEILRIERFIK